MRESASRRKLERIAGDAPAYSRWQRDALLMSYIRIKLAKVVGIEPTMAFRLGRFGGCCPPGGLHQYETMTGSLPYLD